MRLSVLFLLALPVLAPPVLPEGPSDPVELAAELFREAQAEAESGDRHAAEAVYQRALEIYRAAGHRPGEAAVLNNLGLLALADGNPEEALARLEEALALRRSEADLAAEAESTHNLAALYADLGEVQAALDLHRRALRLAEELGDPETQAAALNNLGVLLTGLGRRERAEEVLRRALALHRKLDDRPGEAAALNNLGRVCLRAGEGAAARDLFDQALTLARALGDRQGEADLLNNLGLAQLELGATEKARGSFEAALPLRRLVHDLRGEAATLGNLGETERRRGRLAAAEELLAAALALQRRLGNPWEQAFTLARQARLARDGGRLEAAVERVSEALALVRSLRARLLRPDLRSSWVASQRDLYELLVELLVELERSRPGRGFADRALEAAEAARAQSLVEQLAPGRGGEPGSREQALAALGRRVSALAAEQRRLLEAGQEAEAARRSAELEGRLEEYRDAEAAWRAAAPGDSLRSPPIDRAGAAGLLDRAGIARLLDDDTVLLEYFLGRRASYLWVLTPGSLRVAELPPRSEIEPAARRLHELLARSHERAFRAPAEVAAAALAELLLGPAAGELARPRLAVVPDGALAYLPFAALPLPGDPLGRPLGIAREVVSLPSAGALAALRQRPDPRPLPGHTLAILADPVFAADDPRVSAARPVARGGARPAPSWPRLPATRREAEALARLLPEGEAFVALDFAADAELLTGGALASFRLLHLATHGLIDAGEPELSGLALSLVDRRGEPRAGWLRLLDVARLELAADLVTLSACRTALGREVESEGLVGLPSGFLAAGAQRVLVSLWPVADEAAATFMGRFYAALLGERLPAAAALRAARAALWAEPRWRAPAFWAAFEPPGRMALTPGSNTSPGGRDLE